MLITNLVSYIKSYLQLNLSQQTNNFIINILEDYRGFSESHYSNLLMKN